jgi:hypothetical protein
VRTIERAAAWVVTGPAGRAVAFVLDLGAALIAAAGRRGRGA